MDIIDLRSDTVTKPSKGMKKAIYNAEVGDDVYGDDPTVNHLEKKISEMLGKAETSLVIILFIPSHGHFCFKCVTLIYGMTTKNPSFCIIILFYKF